MRLPEHTEISAVCTHLEHTGRGLARYLMTRLMHEIAARGERYFLQVAADNAGAIRACRALGFTDRPQGWLVMVLAPLESRG